MNCLQSTAQKIEQAEPGKLYEVDYTDPHHGVKGLVARGDTTEHPKVFCAAPGTEVIISSIPLHLRTQWQAPNNAFAIADETGFNVDGFGHVDFDKLEPGMQVLIRRGTG